MSKENDLEYKDFQLVFDADPEELTQSDIWNGLCVITRKGLDKCFDGGQISPLNCQPFSHWMEPNTGEQEA